MSAKEKGTLAFMGRVNDLNAEEQPGCCKVPSKPSATRGTGVRSREQKAWCPDMSPGLTVHLTILLSRPRFLLKCRSPILAPTCVRKIL